MPVCIESRELLVTAALVQKRVRRQLHVIELLELILKLPLFLQLDSTKTDHLALVLEFVIRHWA